MATEPINSGSSSSFNTDKLSSGQFSNDYVRKLIEDKLEEYEARLQAMRSNSKNSALANAQGDETGEKGKTAEEEFTELKIKNLEIMLELMNNKQAQNDATNIT